MRPCSIAMALAGLLVAAPALLAAEATEAARAEPGFVSLFNGKDLTDWDGDGRFWSVKDGCIRGQTTPTNRAPGNTFLIWRGGKPKDFELRLKSRILTGNNSGVQYRSRDFGRWSVGGYQAEVENKPGKVGFLYHERGRGWLVDVGDFMIIDKDGKKRVVGKVADRQALIKAGYSRNMDWNEYWIICRGNHILQYLNGHPTVELIDDDPKGRALEGILALQIHAGSPMTVEFKDIRVKHFKAEFGEAFRLFDGKDLTGWTLSSDGLKNTWSVRAADGVLVNTGRPGGYLRTTKDYTNYVLRMQLRHLRRGNGGVLVRMTGPDKVWPKSIEAQGQAGAMGDIWNIDEFPMKVAADRTRGRHTRKMHKSNEKPLGQWNEYEILLNGGELEILVNRLVQNTATDCEEIAGKICLQSEGAPMDYRNVVLIPILRGEAKKADE